MANILANKHLVIFDLDDTLVYTPREVLSQRLKTILKKAGLPEKEESEINHFYDSHNWDNVIRGWGLNNEEFSLFWKTYINYVENEEKDPTLIFPDTVPCLSKLKEKKTKIALITSATPNYAQGQVNKIGADCFDFWRCVGYHTPIKPKPNPEAVNIVLSYFNEKAEDSAVVGDSHLDIEMAKNAGCLDVLISRNNSQQSIKSTFTIKSLWLQSVY